MKRLWGLLFLFGFVLLALYLFSGTFLQAQSTATLRGTVTDASGAAVPKATVTARNQATGIRWTTETNEEGNYLIPALPAGVYRIEVTRESFQKYIITGLKLDVATSVEQNLRLKVGEISQQVVITGETPVIDTSTMTVGQVINQKTVQEIPLNGRHFVDLSLLTPGTVTPPANGFLTFPLRGQGSFQFNTAGQREDTVNFMINGINLNDMVQNQITFQPSINTVSEFKADNSTYSAEYGRNSGAIVNIATRSGANEFHGEVFDYLRNSAMDARNFFNAGTLSGGKFNPQSPFIRNNFGAAGGGPIMKDKAFFFLSYEGLRQRQGLTTNSQVLGDDERAQALTTNNPTVVKLLSLIPRANSSATTDKAGGFPGQVGGFPNTFIGSAVAPVNIDQGTADLSFNLGQSDRIHGYYALQEDLRQEPTLQLNTIPGFGDTRQSRRQVMTLNYTHVFGPALTNEARLGYNRIHITFTPNALLNPASFGINNGVTSAIGLPQIAIRSIGLNFGGPSGFPQGRGDTTAAFSDALLYLRGKHSWAFGGEIRRFYNNNFNLDTGTFSFPSVGPIPTPTNPNPADFIDGQADRFTVTLGNGASRIVQPAWGAFVQDNYKMLSNLTVELGLRYDWNFAPSEARNRFVVFVPGTGSVGSLVQVGTNRLRTVYQDNRKNVQPRIGFAWDPFKDGKTSVRAGYAVLVDQPVTNLVAGTTTNPPFSQPVTFSSSTSFVTFANALTTAGPAGLSPVTVNPDFKNPYVQSWNLNVQRAITPTLGLTVGYFGSKGTHLRILRNINQPINGGPLRPFTALASTSPIKPGVTLNNISEGDSGGNSSYNALWVTMNKRLAHGLQFNTSYTFSKSIDYNSLSSQGLVTTQDSNNIRNDRGLSDFDVRHRFVISGFYELPLKGTRLLEGWEIGSIVQAQSGNPLTVITSNNGFTGNATLRPDIIGRVTYFGDPANFFSRGVCNPAVAGSCTSSTPFALPGSGSSTHFGNLGRNAIRGPGFTNVDLSLIKNTRIRESMNLQFRAEAFDLLNHPNFGNPGRVAAVGSTSFSVITGTRFPTGDFGSSRQMQISLRLLF